MPNAIKSQLLDSLNQRFGKLKKLENSQSLYEVGSGAARIYIRYSKVHRGDRTFYGLRKEDLRRLEGCPSVICFLWDGQAEPLFVPFSDYEDVFQSIAPAGDGQYKVQVQFRPDGNDLYIANGGTFNVEAYAGWEQLANLIHASALTDVPALSHSMIQTLLGSIGAKKGYDVWIPHNDRAKLDWAIAERFECSPNLPHGYDAVEGILSEVDVLWLHRGAGKLRAMFEVEHSTPIYSGLLRMNDIHLTSPDISATFGIVSNDDRRALFVRQINRPTFKMSNLSEHCTFLEYVNVFAWHKRLSGH